MKRNRHRAMWRVAVPLFLTIGALPGLADAAGAVAFRLADDGRLYRMSAAPGAVPEDLTAALDRRWPGGGDAWLNLAPDGSCFLVESERFDERCRGWACLALLRWDLEAVEVIEVAGDVVHCDGFSAVSDRAARVVFPASGGPHDIDLWLLERRPGGWQGPLLLTAGSPFQFNAHPAFAADANALVFDCGDSPYGQEGTALCAVNASDAAVRVLLTPQELAGATAFHHPAVAADGSIVFEADVFGEQIWRLTPGQDPLRVAAEYGNDNSPCVLADGRIVSLWLGREGGSGVHELKIMDADGSHARVLLPGRDVFDIGISCATPVVTPPPPRRAAGRIGRLP